MATSIQTAPTVARTPPRRWGEKLLVAAVVFTVTLVVLVRRALTSDVSLWDEGYHLSYVQYARDWILPRLGDEMNTWGTDLYTCRPVPPFGLVTSLECGADGPNSMLPDKGLNTAANWPPIYYLLAANLMRPLLSLGLEPLAAARLVSAGIWALGAALLGMLVLAQSSSRILGISAGVIAGLLPATWGMSAFVTPHSSALLIGTLNVAALVMVWTRALGPLAAGGLGAACGALAALTIPHSIVAVAVASLAGLTLALRDGTRRFALVAFAGAAVAAGVVGYLGWQMVRRTQSAGEFLGQPSYPYEGIKAAVRDNWNNFWPAGIERFWPPGSNDFGSFWAAEDIVLSTLLMYGSIALVGYWLILASRSVQHAVAVGVAVAIPLCAVVFALLLDYPVPPRYGASALACVAFLLAIPTAGRILKVSVAGVAVLTWGVAWLSTDHFLIQVW
jgi:hypothetical protein